MGSSRNLLGTAGFPALPNIQSLTAAPHPRGLCRRLMGHRGWNLTQELKQNIWEFLSCRSTHLETKWPAGKAHIFTLSFPSRLSPYIAIIGRVGALLNHFPQHFDLNRARGKDARGSNATSSSGVVAGRYDISARDNDKVESLAGARAAATKSRLFRYSARWHEIAMLHRLLETGSNKQPARGTLDMIERVMRGEAQ